MATQAVNTILQTIGGAERLQTGVAERVATKKYDEAMQQQQDRLEREQAALDAIAEIDAKDIAPTQVRAVQGEIDELNAKIGRGELDVNDINAEVARIKNNYNSYKSEWDLVKEDLKTKITDPEAFISMDEQGNETTKDVIRVYADQFLGDGVYTPESSMTVRASQGALMPHEEIDQKEMISTINNFYATNKDLFTSIGDIDPQLFYSKVTSGGLSNDEKTALTNYLKETYSPQLAKMASRRGYDREGFATGYIGSIIPQAQLKSEYAQAKETEEQKQRAKKRIEEEEIQGEFSYMKPKQNSFLRDKAITMSRDEYQESLKKSYGITSEEDLENLEEDRRKEFYMMLDSFDKSKVLSEKLYNTDGVYAKNVRKGKVDFGGKEYVVRQVFKVPMDLQYAWEEEEIGTSPSGDYLGLSDNKGNTVIVPVGEGKNEDIYKNALEQGISFELPQGEESESIDLSQYDFEI